MADNRPIGVFDSGLGGLTVVREIVKQLGNEDIVYFGDTDRVPYGTKSNDTILKFARQDEAFLLSKDVKLIVAACGTVSSVASGTANELSVDFIEVVSHACKAAVKTTKNNKIGVIGTAATINSGEHSRQIKAISPECEVFCQSCTLFVPLVETGWTDENDIVVYETVKKYLTPLIEAQVDTLILGCTHYPLLTNAIKKVMGENVTLINAGTSTAVAVKELLKEKDMLSNNESEGAVSYFVSDITPSFSSTASRLLGTTVNETQVKKVDINSI
ncbi:MAG: glutamate racemase [Acutalibacteraceae bacterium]|nr:glutamate racemase [Acutalibacteraceae bacterium]